jgi:DNA polymerase
MSDARDRYVSPIAPTLDEVRALAAECKACPLWETGTQTVFGEGPRRAGIVMAGEQPGDREDLSGRPFVGPAGELLDRAMAEAGLDRDEVYLTNVVKHFKWVRRGKRRIHQKPNMSEVAACRPWLESELALLEPDLLVCLGATAAQAVLGSGFRVTQHRGEFLPSPIESVAWVTATVHPSSILRATEDRDAQYETFVQDLRTIAERHAASGQQA